MNIEIHLIRSQFRKDVSLPQQLQRAMAAEAEASREGKTSISFRIFRTNSNV